MPGQVQRPSTAPPRRRAGNGDGRRRCLPATSQTSSYHHIRPPPANCGALAGTQPSRRRRSPIALRTSRTMESLRERSGPASGWSRRMFCSCVGEVSAMRMALLTAGCFRRAASLPLLDSHGWDAGGRAGSRRASRCTYTKKKKLGHRRTPENPGSELRSRRSPE